jgi:hypothetical protein
MKSTKKSHKSHAHVAPAHKEEHHNTLSPKLKKYLPHIVAFFVILVINIFYFFPALSGKTLYQGDLVNHKGMSQEVYDYYKKTGDVALWTNSMFSGMPAYQISAPQKHNLLDYIYKTLKLGFSGPQGYFIMGMIGFYFLFLVLGFNPWLGLLGAFAYSFLTNNIFLLEAGHMTKISTIMLAPYVLAGVILILRKKYLLGGLIFSISMGLQLLSNHVQMTYYLGFVLAVFVIIEYIRFIMKKDFKAIGITALIFIIGIILAVGSSASKLWTTYEYSKETMRGEPILKADGKAKSSSETKGLEWDYAMNWSNGTLDLISTFIPGVAGGGNNEKVSKDSEFAKKYRQLAGSVPSDLRAPLYWGALPSTSGPPYMGALILFLFVFGMFIIKSKYKWWALISVLLLFLLSLGKNLEFFNRLFYDYFPLYNKFRTPNSIMSMAGIPIVFFALYTLKHLLVDYFDQKNFLRYLYITLGITGGISLFFLLFGSSFFDFNSAGDQQYKQYGLVEPLIATRKSLMSGDAFRTLFIVLLGAGLVWTFIKKKITGNILMISFAVIIFFDLTTVDLRYVNHKSFVTQKNIENAFSQREVDKQILADPDPYYRVFDLSVDPFNSAMPAYWHKNIGGYHAAKLQRYQDIIDKYISKGDRKVLDMLNTRYIIQKKENTETVSKNPDAMGNAWLVDSIKMVPDANEEIEAIGKTNLKTTAIINQEFNDYMKNFDPDPTGKIMLTSYSPDKLEYKYKVDGAGFLVFSDIWYGEKNGWKAYIDDKPADFIRANYILRGMKVPAGEHKVVFEFKPRSYIMGEKISLFSSLLILLLGAGYLFYIFYYKKKKA